jgi:resuscitation-promoting factor RpfB
MSEWLVVASDLTHGMRVCLQTEVKLVELSVNRRAPILGDAMKGAIVAVLAASGLVLLGACGSVGGSASAPTKTVQSSATPSSSSNAATGAAPVVKQRTITERRAIPFDTRRVRDPSLAKGTTKVRARGVAGVKVFTYELTFTNGVQTAKRLIRTMVAKRPVTRVIAIGTKQVQHCDPNYSGACVPIASDVDCAGGSGNGPAYVQGPVRVVGTDIYGLDSDGDGIGCED